MSLTITYIIRYRTSLDIYLVNRLKSIKKHAFQRILMKPHYPSQAYW